MFGEANQQQIVNAIGSMPASRVQDYIVGLADAIHEDRNNDQQSRPRAASAEASSELAIETETLPAGVVDKDYAVQLGASGGAAPYKWQVESGEIPAGLSLSKQGMLSGVPSAAGTAEVTISVTDAATASVSAKFSIEVSEKEAAGGSASGKAAGILLRAMEEVR